MHEIKLCRFFIKINETFLDFIFWGSEVPSERAEFARDSPSEVIVTSNTKIGYEKTITSLYHLSGSM